MSYAETLLADGERILYRTKQHWLAPLVTARWAVGLIVLALVLLIVGRFVPGDAHGQGGAAAGLFGLLGWITFAILLIGLAWLAKVWLAWSAEDYVVSDRRVLKIEGIVNKHAADSSLDKINDAVVEQHLLGRMLGYGDLAILTAAEEAVDRYSMLDHVLTFKRNMLNAKHDMESGYERRPAPMPAPPLRTSVPTSPVGAPAPAAARPADGAHRMTPDEVTETLSRLADLRDRGAITPEEYESKKAQLLDRL